MAIVLPKSAHIVVWRIRQWNIYLKLCQSVGNPHLIRALACRHCLDSSLQQQQEIDNRSQVGVTLGVGFPICVQQ